MTKAKRKDRANFLKKWKANGKKTTFYTCLHCLRAVETIQPNKNEVSSKRYWDSLSLCPHCQGLNFVKVYPSGKTNVRGLCTDGQGN